jgi:hypothetical protein
MTDPQDPDKSMNYRIRVAGKLKQSWSDWFNGMTIEFGIEDGEIPVTTLTGPLLDQSALHGVLGKIRNLGLELLLVEQIDV